MNATIGLHLCQQHGDMHRMRDTWMEAEELGVSRIFVADHFHAQVMDAASLVSGHPPVSGNAGKNFESTTLQAAIAATTSRMEIGCTVHAIHFRNPNLLADIARTIDHISKGRYILGIGSGYLREEYEDYGYQFGTQKERLLDLARAIPTIKARFEKLNPKPLRRIPLLIASMGEQIGMRMVAEHADMWHVFGPIDKIRHKLEVFRRICAEVGRDPAEIEILGSCEPLLSPDNDPDIFYHEFGIKHLFIRVQGPDFDLGPLRELIAWQKALG